MSNRVITILAAAGVAIALLMGYVNYEVAATGTADFEHFHSSICQLQAQQSKGTSGFIKLLETLDRRAIAREHVEAANGNATGAAADADSARLYQSVLDSYAQNSTSHVSLSC